MVKCYAEDLQTANKLQGEINRITCFHCQQAAEKYIKGLLQFGDEPSAFKGRYHRWF